MSGLSYHGWGMGGVTLSVAPSPTNSRAVALILSEGGAHEVMAEFVSEHHADDVMAFLDGAFGATAQANAALVQRVEALGG